MDGEARLEEIRRQKRVASKLRKMGKPRRILPHELEVAKGILRDYHDRGMSHRQLGDQMGCHSSTVSNILTGKQKTMFRETFEAVKTVVFEPPSPEELRTGAHTSPVGTARRVQALYAEGFTCKFLSNYLGLPRQSMSNLLCANPKFVFTSTVLRIAEMYDKLAGTNPLDYGIGPTVSKVAREDAAKRGYVNSDHWDEATIDDPDATPDYTGMCGTLEGMITHLLKESPPCGPCKAEQPSCRGVKVTAGLLVKRFYRFNFAAFTETMNEKGIAAAQLENEVGLAKGVVVKWLRGSQGMSFKTALKVADHLDLLWVDLYERITDS